MEQANNRVALLNTITDPIPNLDRHIELQPGVTGAVHFSHSAFAKQRRNFV